MKLFMPYILLATFFLPSSVLAGTAVVESKPDLSRHPLYSRYDFGTTPEVIDFGTQPLAVPIGVIGEVMKRDRILSNALKKNGLGIRFHPFLKGDDIIFFLKQGKIDAAMSGDMPTIMAAAELDIVVPALAKQGFSSIVARSPTTIADLKGKQIGYPPISNAHYALLAALSSVGFKETDVRLMPMDVSQMVDALAAQRVDAIVAWEPVPSIALKQIGNAKVIFKHFNSSYLFCSRSLADRHPEAASLILAAMVRAFAWMRQNEEHLLQASEWTLEAGKRLQGKPVGLSAAEIALLTSRDILGITTHPTIPEKDLTDKGSIRKKLDFLKARGIVPAATATEKVLRSFDRQAITRVLMQPKKYLLTSFDYDMGRADK